MSKEREKIKLIASNYIIFLVFLVIVSIYFSWIFEQACGLVLWKSSQVEEEGIGCALRLDVLLRYVRRIRSAAVNLCCAKVSKILCEKRNTTEIH